MKDGNMNKYISKALDQEFSQEEQGEIQRLQEAIALLLMETKPKSEYAASLALAFMTYHYWTDLEGKDGAENLVKLMYQLLNHFEEIEELVPEVH